MKLEKISVISNGYVYCQSSFYTAHDCLSEQKKYNFSTGINTLIEDIDSGIWAVSYLLSMYKHRMKDFILFQNPTITVNNTITSIGTLSEYSCYMDAMYPLFNTNQTVHDLISSGLKKNNSNLSVDDIRILFSIDRERFERPLSQVGNEIFKAMGAIGHAYGKQIFCFPWLSKKRFDGYHLHMTYLLDVLKSLDKIVVLPMGK